MAKRWVALALLLVFGCSRYWTARFSASNYAAIDAKAPFVKCHMRDGEVWVLESWSQREDVISGDGLHYDADRKRIGGRTKVELAHPDIALLETNRPEEFVHKGLIVLGVVAAASLVVTAACLANPKACFGSCPTFYAFNGTEQQLMAEGFSASVTQAMEATDVDALVGARLDPDGGFSLTMKNEAIETQLIGGLRLGVVPSGGRRVLRAQDRYFIAEQVHPPTSCRARELDGERRASDCTKAVGAQDGLEYLSETDAGDLGAREELLLRFPHPKSGRLGLVIGARNSLLNTYLFYQAQAFMGLWAGDYMRLLERNPELLSAAGGVGRALGGVDIALHQDGQWRPIGSYDEVGPIAKDVQLWLLPSELPPGELELSLSMVRGNYKLDEVALVELGEELRPRWFEPDRIGRAGRDEPSALALLNHPPAHLVTYPGDFYRLHFSLPAIAEPAFFLEARGYYYEWTRESWLPEEDPPQLRQIFQDPRAALISLAPGYKKIEHDIERIFFESRIGERR